MPASVTEALRAEYMPEMPPIEEGAAYLLGYLMDMGPVLSGGMGAVALTYGELDAWCNRMGISLAPWESRFLRRLSSEYASESHKATTQGYQAPWLIPGEKPEPTAQQLAGRAVAEEAAAAKK